MKTQFKNDKIKKDNQDLAILNGYKHKKGTARATQTTIVKYNQTEVQTDFWQTRAYAHDIPKDLPEIDNYTTGDESL